MFSVYEAFDWMLPGQFEAFADRKAFCERQVKDGIDGGATQILVLGAGYDTMGWRLAPEFSGVNFFEIDHPATDRLHLSPYRSGRSARCRPVDGVDAVAPKGRRRAMDPEHTTRGSRPVPGRNRLD
jgi:hypothetical protein